MSVSKYHEYDGGYARTTRVDALLAARVAGKVKKAELRMFFAQLEHDHTGTHVPIDAIINSKRKQKKRLTSGEQKRALDRLEKALQEHAAAEPYGVKLPRKFVRSAAQGYLEVSQMVVALCYFLKRMPQRSRRKSLVRGERYGRLSVRTIERATGLCKEVIVKALRVLRRIKLIALVWRPMQEVKRFGRLFVDGVKVSITYQEPEHSRSSAPSSRVPNTRTMPPRKQNKKKETLTKNSFLGISNKRKTAIERFAARFCPERQLK